MRRNLGVNEVLWANPVGGSRCFQSVKSGEAIYLSEVYFKGPIVYPSEGGNIDDFKLRVCHDGLLNLLIAEWSLDPTENPGIFRILLNF